ncbi:hypothetical protein ACR6C2_08475 [Streptomyces sp. INA 01156]
MLHGRHGKQASPAPPLRRQDARPRPRRVLDPPRPPPRPRPRRNQTLGDNPARQFASRFLVAYCNDDQETDVALFGAAARIGGEHFVRCVTQLFADTAGLVRAAMQKTEAEGG